MKSILDPAFRYTPSFSTDLQKTFARIRRSRLQVVRKVIKEQADAPPVNVSSIVRRSK